MQEIYSMILNSSITTVIAIIFLWQYITNAKRQNEREDKENNSNNEYLKNIFEILKEIKEKLK